MVLERTLEMCVAKRPNVLAIVAQVLAEIGTLVCGEKGRGSKAGWELDDDNMHWSVKPDAPAWLVKSAKMIHYHKQVDMPEDWCKRPSTGECKGVQGIPFPGPEEPVSCINGDGKLNYKRGRNDRMVVPYNPWLLLYFRSHINVQISSTTNVVYYLFKCACLPPLNATSAQP